MEVLESSIHVVFDSLFNAPNLLSAGGTPPIKKVHRNKVS
ncbi:unnamed protein product [Brassica rapa subsp. narinosa]